MDNKIKNQSDLIGKIITYRNELEGINKEVAVCGVAFKDTSVMKVTIHPINLYGEIYNASINLSRQKQGKKDLENTGDWYFIKEASKEERDVMGKLNH